MVDYAIHPGQCALLIYDMTDELIDPSSPGYSAWVAEKLATLRRLIGACHRSKIPVYYALPQSSVDKRGIDKAADAICDLIKPGPEDTIIIRPKSGAFLDSPLEALLRQQGRTTLLIGGMAVDRGCNTAARDAHNRGLKPVIVQDVCFTRDIEKGSFGFISKEEIHRAHLASLERAVAKIATVEELIEAFVLGD